MDSSDGDQHMIRSLTKLDPNKSVLALSTSFLPSKRKYYKQDKNCQVCKTTFDSSTYIKTEKLACKFCYRGVCAKCSHSRAIHPETMKEERICNNCYKEGIRSQILEESRTTRYTKNSPDKLQSERSVTPDTISTRSFAGMSLPGYSQQDCLDVSFTSSIMGSLTPRSMQRYTVTPVISYNNPAEKEEFEKKMQELEEYTKTKDEEVMNIIESLKKEKETSDTKAAVIEQKLEAVEHELTEKVDKMKQLNEELADLRGKYEKDRHQIENLVIRLENNQHENTEILKKLNTTTHGLQTDHQMSKEEFQKSYREMLEAQNKILEENRTLATALKESTDDISQLQNKIQGLQTEIKSEEKDEFLNTKEDSPTNDEFNILEQEMQKQRNELEMLRREIHNRKPSKDYVANSSCRGCIVF